MQRQTTTVAPGANVLVRDEAWRVRKIERTSEGRQAIHAVGISELVRDRDAIFIRELEETIGGGVQILAPETTEIVADTSSGYTASLLYMESLLRRMPPTDAELHVGHTAAMDVLDFQLEPTLLALDKPRPRILIADAVGLGKTLSAGVLLSELIRRGRGKRILVVAIKSMLTQFQKEMWSRFTIPLVRLDSVGLQRIRARIPTNQNPFYYYDKAIISIDTLKQNNEYRHHLENAYWDIIVVDEAHNVAARGKKRSQRADLAELLAHRSDALLMLSATPHDGRAQSFASLMNMLDPTAIANPEDYGPEDIDGLYVRRFKHDIRDQVKDTFPDREILKASCPASEVEEASIDRLMKLRFDEEVDAIVAFLGDDHDVWRSACVVARTQKLLDQYGGELSKRGLQTFKLSRDGHDDRTVPGVRLATMHRVKGLEFDRVIVAGVNEGVVPLKWALQSPDTSVREAAEKAERSLLYVAVTRARRHAMISAHGTPSPFLNTDDPH